MPPRDTLDALWARLGTDDRVVRWTYTPGDSLPASERQAIEARAGITLAEPLRALYEALDGAHLEWSAPVPLLIPGAPFDDRAAVGLIELLPAAETFLPEDDAPAPWHGALYGDDWGWPEGDAEAERAIKAFRPIDWFVPDASRCVGVSVGEGGHVSADLFYYDSDLSRPEPLGLGLPQYLEFLVATGGLLGGREYLRSGDHRTFVEYAQAIFPGIDLTTWAPPV